MNNVSFSDVKITDGFWKHYGDLNRSTVIRCVYDRFKETGRFDALRCDWKEGSPNKPHIYWDSDVAKWIESVAYLTQMQREPELEAIVDEAVEQIVKNQKPSGYFNSYYITCEPDVEFQLRCNHELYCAGHLMEAAVAYDKATGKDKFLKAMMRYADYIYEVFFVKHSAGFVTPGHEEIELALIKMAHHTGIDKYRELAKFFIDNRAKYPDEAFIADNPDMISSYSQSDTPPRKTTEAKGHAVRACYLYSAMAALAKADGDSELFDTCKTIYNDIVTTKLSVTGGIGACIVAEAFHFPYVLPNTHNYNETCAAISLAMFAEELQNIEMNSEYGDLIERILYNGFLSGLSLDGTSFFYENALEIDLRDYQHPYYDIDSMDAHTQHVHGLVSPRRLERAKVFSCSCCPPNITRTLATVSRFMYTVDGNKIYCNQFAQSEAELTVDGEKATLKQTTDYPNDGKIVFTYSGKAAELYVRVPGWCAEYQGKAENGYARFDVTDGSVVEVSFPMKLHFVEADPRVRDCAGRCAVMYGPFVYCMEGVDNGSDLRDVELLADGDYSAEYSDEYGACVLTVNAQRHQRIDTLYRLKTSHRIPFRARLIPYYAFANRGASDMLVWATVR